MSVDPFAWYLTSDLEAWDAANPRHQQVHLGPSDVDRCLRQSAFQHHGYPKTDERSRGQALLGSLIHAGWSAVIGGQELRNADVTIKIPGLGSGHADDVDYRRRIVNDVKTANARSFERYVTFGLPDRMWDQVEMYAFGLWWMEQDALDELIFDQQPWTIAVTLINRETGESERFEQPADLARGQYLVERMIERQATLDDSRDPYDIAREGSGPGVGFPCDYCDWLSSCWGEPREDGLSRQSASIIDDPASVGAYAEEYLAASEEASKAEKAKKAARAFLEGVPKGQYGNVVIGWQGGNPKADEPDKDAAVQILTDLGIEIPLRTGLRTNTSIRVRRAKPDEKPVKPDSDRVDLGHATLQTDLGGSAEPPPSDRPLPSEGGVA